MTVPAVGSSAPEMRLRSQYGEPLDLGELLEDGPVLLVFYPFAFSSVCGGEMHQLIELHDRFRAAGITVVGVSVDSKYALQAWSMEMGIPFSLAADFWPHGAVARAYGVFDEDRGMATRGTFLIGASGMVEQVLVHGPVEARDFTVFLPAGAPAAPDGASH